MNLRVEDYVLRFRDTAVERELAAALRKENEEDRLRFIQELFASGQRHSYAVALWLARTCLCERHSFETILDQGLNQADAGTIKHWLEAVVNGLGFRRVVSILKERLSADAQSVIRARYWLPKWLPRENQAAVEALAALDRQIEERIKEQPDLELLMKPIQEDQSCQAL